MKKPKVIIHTPSLSRADGGVGNSFARIINHLSPLFEFVVITPNPEAPHYTFEQVTNPFNQIQMEVYEYCSSGNKEYRNQFLTDLIVGLIKEQDISGVFNFYLGPWTAAVTYGALFTDTPLFNFGRGNDIDLGIYQEYRQDILKSLTVAKRNFCVSTEMEHKILALVPNAKTEFVANSIAIKEFKKNEYTWNTEKPLRFGLIGHIKRKKGLELIIDKINYHAGEELYIIGDLFPAQAKFLHGFLTLNHQYGKNIHHIEFETDHHKLLKHYNEIDIVVIPSLHDGMPNVMLEAMAMGKLVVASDIGGISDVITHQEDGFLFNPFSEEAIYQTIEQVRKLDPETVIKIQNKAMSKIENSYRLKFERKRYQKIFKALFNLADLQVDTTDHYTSAR